MAKTFNSVMLGFAIKEGQVKSVKDPVIHYLPDLRGTAYDGATLEDLLRMRSGTDWNDNFFVPGPAKDINERSFIRNEARYVSAASWPKRKHAPGASFNYNTVDAALIGRVVEVATGKPINQYMSERLWKPAGMQSYGFYVLDGPPGVGHAFTGGGGNAVMRDYGRIGQLMLEGGVANGRRLLDATWVSQSTADSDPATLARPGMGYGYFWWTLKGGAAYTALGGEGQFLFVDPATRTVIVKLSHANVGPGADKTMGETIAFLQAASAWTPAATR
jgi:CubicO group peptidase (beta-lactamase class C family)